MYVLGSFQFTPTSLDVRGCSFCVTRFHESVWSDMPPHPLAIPWPILRFSSTILYKLTNIVRKIEEFTNGPPFPEITGIIHTHQDTKDKKMLRPACWVHVQGMVFSRSEFVCLGYPLANDSIFLTLLGSSHTEVLKKIES